MAVTYLFRRTRLAGLLREPGGITCPEAFAAAHANLLAIRNDLLAEVDSKIALLLGCTRGGAVPPCAATRRAVYDHANVIAGIAGACGLRNLGEAAYSLCELVDGLIETGRWHAEAIEVHLSAILLMRDQTQSGRGPVRGALLERLAHVVRWTTAQAGPPLTPVKAPRAGRGHKEPPTRR